MSKTFRGNRGLSGWLRAPGGPGHLHVLEEVTFQASPGEVLAFVGPNGAGKSTLLKILATLVLPDGGSAQVGGYDVVEEAAAVRRHLGVMLELERSFYARLSGFENLQFFATLYELNELEARQRISELLDWVGLAKVGERPFMKYSLGMQHRLGLARALLPNPPILLLDEPTRSLDPTSAQELRKLLRDELARGQGKTILLASHSLAEVEQICDRVAILNRGRVVALGSQEELAQQFNCSIFEEIYRKSLANGEDREGL